MSCCPSSLDPPKSQDCVGLRKGFVTNMRSINLSFVTASFLSFTTKSGDTHVFLGEGWLDRLYNSLSRSLLSHIALSPFFFVRSRTVRSIHLPCTQDTSNDKNDKGLAQTGVRAEGGMSTLPCAGGGRNPIN